MWKHSVEDLTAVVGLLYEAGYDQERWPEALRVLGESFGASRTCIVRVIANSDGTLFTNAVGSYADQELEELLDNPAAANDPYTIALRQLSPGHVYARRTIVDERAFRQRELWQSWMKRREMGEALNSVLAISPTSFLTLDISRRDALGAYRSEEIDLLQQIIPHIMRAGQIGEMLEGRNAISALYAQMPFDLLVTDANLRVLHMNEGIERLLGRPDMPLLLAGGSIVATNRLEAAKLLEAVIDASRAPLHGAPAMGGAMIMSGLSKAGAPRLAVSVAPMSARHRFGLGSRHCAAIMIRELGVDPTEALQKALPRLFGLSPSESRLAAALATGRSLKLAAADQNITFSSARTYLEAIFRKTGTHRQGELVALLKNCNPL